MVAAVAAGIGAAASLAAAANGMQQGRAGAQAAAANNALGVQNYQLQRWIAQQQMEMAQAGQTDARGNRTTYVPGVGWVTTPTELTRQVADAGDRENLQQNTVDAQRSRLMRSLQATRQLREG